MKNQFYWTTTQKILFRFAFIFLLSFILLKNKGAFPGFDVLCKPFISILQDITPWFANNMLNYVYDSSTFSNGSSDTSYEWVSLLILFVFGIIGSLIWSILDKHRPNYNTHYYWLTVFIRYYIAFTLFSYGAIKLIHAQMPPPTLNKLMQPLHEFSPMGLAWTFLGFSKGYNIFIGIVEILAVLLLFRKTMIIGALIAIAASMNIMAVNYFFDVPVKMLSTVLFIFSLILLIPNIKTLFTFFIQGKPAELRIIEKPLIHKLWIKKSLVALKIIFITMYATSQFFLLANRQMMISQHFKKSSINGIFKVDFQGKLTNTIPSDWNYIIFEYEGTAVIRDTNYKGAYKEYILDEKTKEITINNFKMNYVIQANEDIVLTKILPSGQEEIKLIKQHKEDFELLKRGFNLIQEYPYNR